MKLKEFFEVFKNEPAFRLKQAKKSLFVDYIDTWQEASNLSLALRKELEETVPLELKAQLLSSKDKNSHKVLLTLEDGAKIESVLMRHKDGRDTVCLSSQVGCPLNCSFCATGSLGLERNLSKGEIIDQVLFWGRYLKKNFPGERISNLVFMGMGEPFLNYSEVMGAIRLFNDPEAFNIGARKISISTCGLKEGINKLAKEKLQLNLAVSLHAPDDALRSSLMPVNKSTDLKTLFKAIDAYIRATGRKVMFEYMLLKGVNDSPEAAERLAALMDRPLCFLNIMNYNPTGRYEPSDNKAKEKFLTVLRKARVPFVERWRLGQELEGACGQLAKKGY